MGNVVFICVKGGDSALLILRHPAADFCVWCEGAQGLKRHIGGQDFSLAFTLLFSNMIWNPWLGLSPLQKMFACLARMLQVLQFLLLYCTPPHQGGPLLHTTHDWRSGGGGPRSTGALNVLQGLPAIGYLSELNGRIYICWTSSVFPFKNGNVT